MAIYYKPISKQFNENQMDEGFEKTIRLAPTQ